MQYTAQEAVTMAKKSVIKSGSRMVARTAKFPKSFLVLLRREARKRKRSVSSLICAYVERGLLLAGYGDDVK